MGIIEVVHYDTPEERPQAENKPGLMAMMQDVRRIEKQIERHEDSIRRLDSQKYRCTSNISAMPRGGQKADWYEIDAEIETLRQMIAELRRQHAQLVRDMDRCEEADRLELDEYSILKYKYISDYTYEDIADALKMSTMTVYRKHRCALVKIDKE